MLFTPFEMKRFNRLPVRMLMREIHQPLSVCLAREADIYEKVSITDKEVKDEEGERPSRRATGFDRSMDLGSIRHHAAPLLRCTTIRPRFKIKQKTKQKTRQRRKK